MSGYLLVHTNVSVQKGPLAWLLAWFSRSARLNNFTLNSTLHFLGSSVINPPSVKLMGVEKTEGQTTTYIHAYRLLSIRVRS